WIGDRKSANLRVINRGQAVVYIDARMAGNPKHDLPGCVLVQRTALCQTCSLQFPRVVDVGREKQVEWRAILKLCKEVTRRSEDQAYLDAGLLLEPSTKIFHDLLQIGCSGDRELLLGNDRHLTTEQQRNDKKEFQREPIYDFRRFDSTSQYGSTINPAGRSSLQWTSR